MATSYPSGYDSLPRPGASDLMNDTAGGLDGPAVIDNISDAIEAIEAELGTDPAGAYATVAARLTAIAAASSSALSGFYDVKDATYGAVGDDSTDDTTAIQSALTAGAGAIVYFPEGTYKITADLEVPANTTVTGSGTIHQVTGGQAGLTIMGSGVTIEGITLQGMATDYTAGEDAITATGTSAASPWTDIVIRNVTAYTWGRHAIFLKYIDTFEVASCYLYDLYYSGVMVQSGANGRIHHNRIHDLHGTTDKYGISMTYGGTESATDPSTRDCVIDANVVTSVLWEALSTHGGLNLTFSNNVIDSCKTALALNPGSITSPMSITFVGNTVDGGSDTPDYSRWAFQAVGLSSTVMCEGLVVASNVFRRCAEVYLRKTLGTVVTGNTFVESNGRGVFLYEYNYNFGIHNNTFIDPYGEASTANGTCIATANGAAGYNIGLITGNQLVDGTKTATYLNRYGALLNADTGNEFTVFGNDFSIASVSAATGTTVHRIPSFSTDAGRNTVPDVTGSRGSNAALASLLTALDGLGILTDSSSA